MPITNLLRALLRKPAPESEAKPERVPNSILAETEVDNDVRMHIAANDPHFPAKREAAVNSILAALDTVTAAHGFTKKAQSWAKIGPLGTVSLHLQRSRFGFESHINLCFHPASENPQGPLQGPWAQDDILPLERFFPPENAQSAGLIYLDIHKDPSSLSQHMQILDQQALPWLVAHLTDPKAPEKPLHSEK